MVSLQVLVVALATTATPDAVLLDFYSDSCGPCRQAAPFVEQLKQQGYPVRKVNIDHEPQLAAQFRVTAVPTFIMVSGGKEVARREGFPGVAELEQMCRMAIAPPKETIRGQSPDPFLATSNAPAPSPFSAGANLTDSTASPAHQQSAGSPAPSGKMVAATVRLHIDDPKGHSIGSGTIIDAQGGDALVLTCGHIFRDSQGKGKITIDLFGPGAPQGIEGKVLNWDDTTDVAIVCFQTNYPVTVARIAPVSASPRVGDQVVSVGCDGGANPTARATNVTAINRFTGPANVVVSFLPVQGRSGGGLFNAQAQVIGVCNAADPSENLGIFAAGELIRGELEEAKLLAFCLDGEQGAATPAVAAIEPASNGAAAFDFAQMQQQPLTNLASVPAAGGNSVPASAGLNSQEAAALSAVQNAESAEVICIVRSLNDAQAKSEIVVLDKASPEFLNRLAAERNVQNGRRLTSMSVEGAAQLAPVRVLDGFPKTIWR